MESFCQGKDTRISKWIFTGGNEKLQKGGCSFSISGRVSIERLF